MFTLLWQSYVETYSPSTMTPMSAPAREGIDWPHFASSILGTSDGKAREIAAGEQELKSGEEMNDARGWYVL